MHICLSVLYNIRMTSRDLKNALDLVASSTGSIHTNISELSTATELQVKVLKLHTCQL